MTSGSDRFSSCPARCLTWPGRSRRGDWSEFDAHGYEDRACGVIYGPEAKLQKLLQVIPMRRTGETHEIGPTVVLLLSDTLSPYTTGTFLTIDGGLHLQPLPVRSDEEIKNLNAP